MLGSAGRRVARWVVVCRVLLGCVVAAAGAAAALAPSAVAGPLRLGTHVGSRGWVRVSYSLADRQVTASGSFHAPDGGPRGGVRVVLEQQVGSGHNRRWRSRATASTGRARFAVVWSLPSTRRLTIRVVLLAGGRTLAVSSAHVFRVPASAPVVVTSVPRPGTVLEAPSEVLHATGSQGGTASILLAAGAPVPRIEAALVIAPSTIVPRGVLGIVTAVSTRAGGRTLVSTRPASLDQAYSTFHVHLDEPVSQLETTAHSVRFSRIQLAHSLFECSGAISPISADIDLSALHVLLDIDANAYSPWIQFILEGTPKFTLNYGAGLGVSCSPRLPGISFPIGDTGLFASFAPSLSLSTTGALSAHFTWSPFIGITFFRSLRSGNSQSFALRNGGSATFTGTASATLGIGIATSISVGEVDHDLAAITGTFGPALTETASADASTGQTCLTEDATLDGDLSASAHVLFKNWEYDLGSITYGDLPIYSNCSKTIAGGGGSGAAGSGGSGGGGGGAGSGGGTGGGGGTYTHVVPLGPTSGPAGFGLNVGIPDCPQGDALHVIFDGQSASAKLTFPNSPDADVATVTGIFLAPGTHQVSFACVAAGEKTVWSDPGFPVTVTAPAIPVDVQPTSVAPGGTLTFASGASAGPSPCPALTGYPVTYVDVGLELDSPYGGGQGVATTVYMPDGGAQSETLTLPATLPPGTYTAEVFCGYGTYIPNVSPSAGYFDFSPQTVTVN